MIGWCCDHFFPGLTAFFDCNNNNNFFHQIISNEILLMDDKNIYFMDWIGLGKIDEMQGWRGSIWINEEEGGGGGIPVIQCWWWILSNRK